MSVLRITVGVDQRAALARGLVLGPTCEIDVDLGALNPAIRARIVELVSFRDGVARLDHIESWRVSEATAEELIRVVAADVAEAAKLRASEAEAKRATIARRLGQLEEFERDGIQRTARIDYGYHWEQWAINEPSTFGCSASLFPPDWESRIAARRAALDPIVADHNAPHVAEVKGLADVEAERRKEFEAVEEVKRLAELAKLAAKRLETGYWERETEAYNERRHGAPWCAKVTFPDGPKPVYEWGDSTAKWGKPGLLRVACRPGECIAWGQKDLRRPGNGTHHILAMNADGRMREVDKTEAFRLWQAVDATGTGVSK